jgi:hypothetical protein
MTGKLNCIDFNLNFENTLGLSGLESKPFISHPSSSQVEESQHMKGPLNQDLLRLGICHPLLKCQNAIRQCHINTFR